MSYSHKRSNALFPNKNSFRHDPARLHPSFLHTEVKRSLDAEKPLFFPVLLLSQYLDRYLP